MTTPARGCRGPGAPAEGMDALPQGLHPFLSFKAARIAVQPWIVIRSSSERLDCLPGGRQSARALKGQEARLVRAHKSEQLQGDGHGRRGAHRPHPDARAGEAVDGDVQERAKSGGLQMR